jgi:polysaccharide biosynthesis/export protein
MRRGERRWKGLPGFVAAFALVGMLSGCGTDSAVGPAGFNSAGVPPTTTASVAPASTASIRRDVALLTASATPGSDAYKIGPQDVLQVTVFQVPDLTNKLQVADNGTINMPLIGAMPAAGMTTRQLEENLTRQLAAKYLQNPQVSVVVSEYNSQRVTIEGAVKKPGVYPIQGRLTLLQSVALAQGLDNTANTSVLILRPQSGNRSGARFDLSEIRSGQASDPELRPGDVVIVSTSMAREAFENIMKMVPLARLVTLGI